MLVYSNLKTKNTYFELWGGSTKHPDVQKVLQWDIENGKFTPSDWIETPAYECFQWLVWCLSDLTFGTRYHLKELLELSTCFDDYGIWA